MIKERAALLKKAISKERKSSGSAVQEGLTDYSIYRLDLKERFLYGLEGILISAVVAYLFYRSFLIFLFLAVILLFLLPMYMKRKKKKKRDERLSSEFKDAITALSGYISAGFSIENAFIEIYRDELKNDHRNQLMHKELSVIVSGLRMNINIESLLMDLAKRSGNGDIISFAQIMSIAKRSGGDMKEIIDRTVNIIRDKTQVSEEINTLTRGIRLEQNVMLVVPFFIIFYIDLSSHSFLAPLYTGYAGRCVMTAALIMIAASCFISRRITDIEV